MSDSGYYVNIPGYVMAAKIEPMAKLCFGVIASLTHKKGFCYATNDQIAEQLDTSDRSVRRYVSALEELGIIRIETDGKYRDIYLVEADIGKVDKSDSNQDSSVQVDKIGQEPGQNWPKNPDKIGHTVINNNIKTNIKNSDTPAREKSNFDEFWQHYPKQRAGSKDAAFKSYLRALKSDMPESILAGCLAYAASDEVARGLAKGCAAWLNDDRWRNDYSIRPTTGPPIKPNYAQTLANAYQIAIRDMD